MKITTVVCDLDGTLIDSHTGIQAAVRRACDEVLPVGCSPELEIVIGPPIRQMMRQALPDADDGTIESLARAYRRQYDSTSCLSYVPYPGVKDTLTQLAARGVALFVLTNKPLIPTQRILIDMGIDYLFRGVVCIDSRQPPFISKCEAGNHLKTSYGLNAASTILVGDNVDDWGVATACGFHFVAATYGYGNNWNLNDARYNVVSMFDELLTLGEMKGNAP